MNQILRALPRDPMARCGAFLIVSLLVSAPALMAQETAAAASAVVAATVAEGGREEFSDEILVTARKREENIQAIPISITALTADTIEQRSLTDLSEIDTFTPNGPLGRGPLRHQSQ